jgi:hypothetical protein
MLKRLVVEFKDELDALGVKVDALDARVGKIESRLGGWKLSGNMRVDLYHATYDNQSDSDGAPMPRTRLEIQRWFGEDEGMHLYIRLNDSQFGYGNPGKGVVFNKFYVEIPVWWDAKVTVGRFAWDKAAAYYLNGTTNFTENMGWGNDSWLTDRTVDGFGFQKSFGLGNVSAYVAHPSVGVYTDYDSVTGAFTNASVSAWEVFAMGELQFTENFGFDIGGQAFFGDDSSTITAGDLTGELDNLYTLFAGFRFDFREAIAVKGLYYYQDASYELNGVDQDPDSTSAFRAVIDVKQDLLKFTSLWLEYDYLDAGFVLPTGGQALVLGGTTDGSDSSHPAGSLGYNTGFDMPVVPDDLSIWRVGAKQVWNDKWSTFAYVANYAFDTIDADSMHWALGVIYKYNPNVQFALAYAAFDSDDALKATGLFQDPSVIRFRTWISF